MRDILAPICHTAGVVEMERLKVDNYTMAKQGKNETPRKR
jgi:hypothetical protein